MSARDDITLILLDIVLEMETAGLELIHWIRKDLQNTLAQIVIRTDRPSTFTEQEMIETYSIHDYIAKTDTTVQRLRTMVSGPIHSYKDARGRGN